MTGMSLPQPEAEILELSNRLKQDICSEIDASGGMISFHRFMEMALYRPGLGYYAAGLQKFGSDGDFVTAPEITPLYGRVLARQVGEILELLNDGSVIEFGAGSGKLAVDMVTQLAHDNRLPKCYLIVEVSAELRQRQQQLIEERLPEHKELFEWLDRPPVDSCEAVVIGNEVLDAMPVHRFRYSGSYYQEEYIQCQNDQLMSTWSACSEELLLELERLNLDLVDGYISEINLRLRPWIELVAGIITRGAVLLADYGYRRLDYYHPDRSTGTLVCHYRHHVHSDALLWPGLQDLTAHVDFTAVAEAAAEAGMDIAGFTTQSSYLIGCGIDSLVNQSGLDIGSAEWYNQAEAVKRLMLPTEMGEVFKIIALTKGVNEGMCGFEFRNMKASL